MLALALRECKPACWLDRPRSTPGYPAPTPSHSSLPPVRCSPPALRSRPRAESDDVFGNRRTMVRAPPELPDDERRVLGGRLRGQERRVAAGDDEDGGVDRRAGPEARGGKPAATVEPPPRAPGRAEQVGC